MAHEKKFRYHWIGGDAEEAYPQYDINGIYFVDGKPDAVNIEGDELPVADGEGVLCQCTGLKDKDGRDIYEGDIVVADRYPFFNEGVPGYVGVIEWAHGAWYYGLECVNKKLRGSAIGDQLGADGEEVTEFRIIGNIYENPELLKP